MSNGIIDRFRSASHVALGFLVDEAVDAPAASPPPHDHEHGEVIIYILDGEMTTRLDDRAIALDTNRGPAGGFQLASPTPSRSPETSPVSSTYVRAALDLHIAELGTPPT